MKRLFFLLIPVLSVLFIFTAGKIVDDKLKSLLTQFKISEDNAKNQIFSNISGPSFYIPGIKVLKDLALGDRASMVESIGKNVKEYVSSKEFLHKYNEYREGKKPSPPEKPKSAAEQKNEFINGMKTSIAEMKKTKSEAPADQKGMYDDIIKELEEQVKQAEDPGNPMFSPEMDVYSQQGYEMQMDQYKKDLESWEKEYPINNPSPLVKKWIESFLEKSKDIDFNAQLKTEKGKQIFVNPAYEKKDYQWKLYFRAGKEPVEAARKFGQGWLSELK